MSLGTSQNRTGPSPWQQKDSCAGTAFTKDQGGDVNLSQALHLHGCQGSATAHCEPQCLLQDTGS